MYYEECEFGGVLFFRGTPTGQWRPVESSLRLAVFYMSKLTDEQRVGVMANFCPGCGTSDLPCHCQRDD